MPAAAVVPQPQPEPKVIETPEPPASEPPPLKRLPPRRAEPAKAPPPRPATAQLPVDDTAPQPLSVAMAGDGAAPSAPAVDYEGLRESYRSRVLARIESFKHYPMAARRQRVEGDLEVDLDIACDGAVASVNVEGGFGVLRSAAARSVKRAAPLPAPPPQLSCPHRLQYAMTYRLR
jgi:protein TonB